MIKDLNNKKRAYITLVIFGIIALAFWYYSDDFSTWSTTANPLLVILVSIVINPAYIFLIYTLYKQYNWRGLIAGILIAIYVDIISLAHSIPRIGTIPTDSALFSYSDTSIWMMINKFISGQVGTFILYVIIPVGIVYLALRIIRKTSSFNRIVRESI